MVAPSVCTLQLDKHLDSQDVQQGELITLLVHGEPRLDVQQGGLVDHLLRVVPRHSVHLGAELQSGQWLTQGWRLLRELLRRGGLVRLLLHVGLLHDLSLLLLLDFTCMSEHN